ncbi:MAG: hypothetical protein G01um101413_638 [Parcubacteria group bacterium Gr01-1014_13]|nr:MAG: hypothetical protein G01um101413_638 [Parcubacteria group bacterium Gr01-1014_13]
MTFLHIANIKSKYDMENIDGIVTVVLTYGPSLLLLTDKLEQ